MARSSLGGANRQNAARAGQSPPGPEVPTVTRWPSADSPMAGRKGLLSSTENSARCSKGARRLSNVQQSTTSKPRQTTTSVPRDTFNFGMDVEEISGRAGLTPLVLTRAEAPRAKETPGIERATFMNVFGGNKNSEWPYCSKVPGYEDFLCTTITAQPFMPIVPGKPGLLLGLPSVPTVVETLQRNRDKSTFHVFLTLQPGMLYYRGKYAKIPLSQIQCTLRKFPAKVRYESLPSHHGYVPNIIKSVERWVKLVRDGKSDTIRAIRARIDLRSKIEREPSASEVQDYMRHQFNDSVTYKEISAAFRSGKEVRETLVSSVIKGYRVYPEIDPGGCRVY